MEMIVFAFLGTFALLFASFAAYVSAQLLGGSVYTGRALVPEFLPRPKVPSRAPRSAPGETLRPAA